jgi:hypothetical protein
MRIPALAQTRALQTRTKRTLAHEPALLVGRVLRVLLVAHRRRGGHASRPGAARASYMYGRDVARGGADGAMRAPDGPSAPGPGLARARA